MKALNKEEEGLFKEAMNHYMHYTINELTKRDLGDIERNNLEKISNDCSILIKKLNAFASRY